MPPQGSTALPAWWVPETAFGFLLCVVMIAWGVAVAQTGRRLQRYLDHAAPTPDPGGRIWRRCARPSYCLRTRPRPWPSDTQHQASRAASDAHRVGSIEALAARAGVLGSSGSYLQRVIEHAPSGNKGCIVAHRFKPSLETDNCRLTTTRLRTGARRTRLKLPARTTLMQAGYQSMITCPPAPGVLGPRVGRRCGCPSCACLLRLGRLPRIRTSTADRDAAGVGALAEIRSAQG
jgi:hypothetical protein